MRIPNIFFKLLVLAAFVFTMQGNVFAAGRTSNTIGTNSALYTNLGGGSSFPLGTVLSWPYEKMPTDSENWAKCEGQSLSGTELCKTFGKCVAPDYRGMFLRGAGVQTVKFSDGTTGTYGYAGNIEKMAVSKPVSGKHRHMYQIGKNSGGLGYVSGGYGVIAQGGMWGNGISGEYRNDPAFNFDWNAQYNYTLANTEADEDSTSDNSPVHKSAYYIIKIN